jgi:hypothetical protein
VLHFTAGQNGRLRNGDGVRKEVLPKHKPERKQQAQGWKLFKSPGSGWRQRALHLHHRSPLKGADYSPSNIPAERPAEVNARMSYAAAYATGQNPVNLQLVVSASRNRASELQIESW